MMTNTSNHRNPSEFVELINAELASAIQSWRRIANHLLSATEQYGTDSDSYKMILKAANFSKSKACKLVAIARDTRLARQPTLFDTVQAWTTLYEVTTLTDEQFDKLISAAPENGSVTPAFVSAIKKGEIQKAPDAYKVAFNIRIDDAALKSESFTGEHYAKLVSLLKQIQDEIPHIRVDNADLFEKNASSEFANLERFMKVARQEILAETIKSYKNSSSEWQHWNNTPASQRRKQSNPMIGIYNDRAEILANFDENPAEVISALSYDGNIETDAYNRAMTRMKKRNDKYFSRTQPAFAYIGRLDEAA